MKKYLLVSPKFNSSIDGLSAHTTLFAKELSRHARVEILTSAGREGSCGNCVVHATIKRWGLAGIHAILLKTKKIRPDAVIFQYVPFLYAKRGGINFGIVLAMALIRHLLHLPVYVIYHELYYPLEWNMKSILMHTCHRIMLAISGRSASLIFASTENFTKILKKQFPKKTSSIHHLPMSSNLVVEFGPTGTEPSHIHTKTDFIVATFGLAHPSKRTDLVIEAVNRARANGRDDIKLLLAGLSLNDVKQNLYPRSDVHLEDFVIATGHIPDTEAWLAMRDADLFVAYFCDGITSRRSSVLAAMSAGVPIISTWSEWSEPVFASCPHITFLKKDPEEFLDDLVWILRQSMKKNMQERKKIGDEIRKYYQQHFSWENIISEFLHAAAGETSPEE